MRNWLRRHTPWYCPTCGREYAEAGECPECRVELTDRRPNLDPVPLCTTASVGHTALVKSVLEGAGIPYGVIGNAGITMTEPVTILVRPDQLAQARALLDSLEPPTEMAPSDAPPGRGSELAPAGAVEDSRAAGANG